MVSGLKALCIVIYLLGLASYARMLPESLGLLGPIALVLLAAHVLELIFMWKYVKRYQGSLAVSVILTLLFGLLHWRPLAKGEAVTK